jgi:hypothetical protein
MIDRNPIISGFELPIRFSYREPGWLPLYYIMLHLGALLSIILTGLPMVVRILLILYIVFSLALWIYTRRFKKAHNRGLQISLNVRNEWTLMDINLQSCTAKLVSARILHDRLIYIRLKSTTGKRYDLWLSRTCADESSLRRLRVRLLLPITTPA